MAGEGMVTGAVGITAAVKSTGPRATTATAETAMATASTARLDSAATLAARLYECCPRATPRSMDSVYAGVTPTATRGTVLTVNPQQSPNTLAVHRVDGGQLPGKGSHAQYTVTLSVRSDGDCRRRGGWAIHRGM